MESNLFTSHLEDAWTHAWECFIEITTKRECTPEKWNLSSGRKSGLKGETKVLNACLDMLKRKVYEAHHTLLESKDLVTVESIKDILTGISTKPKMLLEIFQKRNSYFKGRASRIASNINA